MSFVPLLISLGSSRSLHGLGDLVERVALERIIGNEQAIALLRTELGGSRAQELVSAIAGP